MSSVASLAIAAFFVAFGVGKVSSVKKGEEARREALDAATLIKTEIRFRRTSFSELCELFLKADYKYINLKDGEPVLSEEAGAEAVSVFSLLVSKTGTTDYLGQLELCEEALTALSEILNRKKSESASKIKVYGALTALCALCVLII